MLLFFEEFFWMSENDACRFPTFVGSHIHVFKTSTISRSQSNGRKTYVCFYNSKALRLEEKKKAHLKKIRRTKIMI